MDINIKKYICELCGNKIKEYDYCKITLDSNYSLIEDKEYKVCASCFNSYYNMFSQKNFKVELDIQNKIDEINNIL